MTKLNSSLFGALAGGLGLTVFNTLFETTVQQQVPTSALSRVAAIDWMLSQGLQPIGYALVGPVTAALGSRTPLLVAAGWVVVTTVMVLAVPDVRNLRAGGRVYKKATPANG